MFFPDVGLAPLLLALQALGTLDARLSPRVTGSTPSHPYCDTYAPAERRAHQCMAEQVSARCTLCTPSPSTPRQHARTLTRRWSKPPTTPRAATPSHPHSTRAAAARTPTLTDRNPAMQGLDTAAPPPRSRRHRAHPNARHPRPPDPGPRTPPLQRRVRPPGTAQPRAQEHGTPMP